MSLESFVRAQEPRNLLLSLCTVFLLFYTVQIPWMTTNSDVLAYALRAVSDTPILDRSYICCQGSGNIHLGHTLILWLVYHIVPKSLSQTIWPAGLVSAVSGACIVGLTLLLWLQLGLDKALAVVIACVVGLIPSIWYHNLIGEMYSLQLSCILFFAYFFLRENLILATVGFLASVLVSPTSAASFPIVLLAPRNRPTYLRAVAVGVMASVFYLVITFFFNADLLSPSSSILWHVPQRRSDPLVLLWVRLLLIIVVNINFLLLALFKGSRLAWQEQRGHLVGLLPAAVTPQLAYLFLVGPGPFSEVGHQQLSLLWACGFPIGLAIAQERWLRPTVLLPILGGVLLTLSFWMIRTHQIATAREEAGHWLKAQPLGDIPIIGNWNAGLSLATAKYGWDLERVATHSSFALDVFSLDAQALSALGHKSLIIVESKQSHPSIRSLLSVFFPAARAERWDPSSRITAGSIRLIFENEAVVLYKWDAP